MTKTKIIVTLLEKVDRILIDYSSLMGTGFVQFIKSYSTLFVQHSKKIVIAKPVYLELIKCSNSTDQSEANKARNIIDIINENQEIFYIDRTDSNVYEQDSNIETELISDLTLHLKIDVQLLISNDQGLAKDAINLNHMKCVSAKNLYVFYISESGCLYCSEMVTKQQKKIKSQTVLPIEKKEQKPSNVENKQSIIDNKEIEDEKGWRFDWKSGLITLFGCAATSVAAYGIYKGLNHK